ncbi:CvpA family protein [Oscillibacter sp.]|uniref:CvpA family protein n=1 Tax=Oscillibacter sp. TaxID=1945593 RepID=UPI002620B0A4|nr:CvpA family protein [Oscillibacter sp.]MDD3346647.1 CvpA family protein [Oscillibacter sp.]
MPFSFNFGGFDPNAFGGGFNPGGFPGKDSSAVPPQQPQRPRKPRKAIGNAFTRTLINLGVTLAAGLVYFYLELPALNLHAEEFYVFAFLLCAVYCVCAVLTSGFQGEGVKGYVGFVKKQCVVPFVVLLGLIAAIAIGAISSWVVLRAGAYSEMLPIQTGDFTTEVEEISYDQIPMLDADSASRLGTRKLGELADMVSQFEILPTYTQINYQGRPVRVTSLRYGDLIKWFTNRTQGLPAYVIIDMVTQEAEVVRLDEGMKYTVAEHFGRNLYRHLRFNYPTMMFDEPMFEIDETGTPYWVCSRIVKTIGLFGGMDVNGAVLVNAITGESEYYEQVPSWVDRVYSADIIVQQYDYYGQYHNGFLNSMFGQRDVTITTDGYNYIAIGDDVYMYTGVTSVTSDQSNIGFILSNQRTKETHFYSIAGAEEFSAMSSAQSKVQQMNYQATFPLLLNIADQPTYFLSLKGADGLVKMYAMVNVQQYQIVETGQTVAECESSYRRALAQSGLISAGDADISSAESRVEDGVIAEIRTAVIDGNTHYYVRMEHGVGYLDFSAEATPRAVLLDVGDHIWYRYELQSAEFPENGIVRAKNFWFEGETPPGGEPA